jgi:hypothetical protein
MPHITIVRAAPTGATIACAPLKGGGTIAVRERPRNEAMETSFADKQRAFE